MSISEQKENQFLRTTENVIPYPDSVLSQQDSILFRRQYWAKVKVWREQQAKLTRASTYRNASTDSLYNRSWCFGDRCYRREQNLEYKLVLSSPGRLAVEPRPQTTMNSDGISFVLFILFLLTAFSFKSGYRSIFHRIRYLLEVKKRENIFFDSTVNEVDINTHLPISTSPALGLRHAPPSPPF